MCLSFISLIGEIKYDPILNVAHYDKLCLFWLRSSRKAKHTSYMLFTISEMSLESVVDLNVGGLLYTTSIGTLTKVGTFKKILSLSL